jgi:hypothetical protein
MNTTIKFSMAACSLIAGIAAPLTAGAETYVFSGRGAYGQAGGSNGSLYMDFYAFQEATKSKSVKSKSSGVWVYGSYYAGPECWTGYAFIDNVTFQSGGKLQRVVAVGSVPMTWYEYCGSYAALTEDITFNIDLTALTDQMSSSWGSAHDEYGNIRINRNYNSSSAPAATEASSITSPAFGTVTPSYGYVGQSKSHDVQIMR